MIAFENVAGISYYLLFQVKFQINFVKCIPLLAIKKKKKDIWIASISII